MRLEEQLDLLEARRDAYSEIKKIMARDGGRLYKYGLYGVRVANRAWAGLRDSIERAGGKFTLKTSVHNKNMKIGHVVFNGHKFNVEYEPNARPGEGDHISISDGTL